jgi:oligoribonuclease
MLSIIKEAPMTCNAHNLIWIDLEMTGLHPEKDRIIEIATIVTDTYLNIVAEGPNLAIYQSDALLDGMDEWNTTHHRASGLIDRVKVSTISESQAMEQTLSFLKHYVPAVKSPMCGNSVWQDRRFLARYMPELEQYFHYRMIDVSTLKELAMRWAPAVYEGVKKESQHLALQDIRESIEELKYYRSHLLK